MTKFRHTLHILALVLIIPILLLAALVIFIRYLTCIVTNIPKAWMIALTIDDTANVALNGRLGQTISSRAAVAWKDKKMWGCVLCSLLDEVSPNHCANALTAKDQNL